MNVPLTSAPASSAPYGSDVNTWTLLAAVAVLVPVCFWVYNDAKMRYNNRGVPLLWSVLVFSALIVFLPLYLMVRPPRRQPADPGAPPDDDR